MRSLQKEKIDLKNLSVKECGKERDILLWTT